MDNPSHERMTCLLFQRAWHVREMEKTPLFKVRISHGTKINIVTNNFE